MNFFESYAVAVMRELSEDSSNLVDIYIDWRKLCKKENTKHDNNTSQQSPKTNTHPHSDGSMSEYTPRTITINRVKLRNVWRSTKLDYSVPITMNGHPSQKPVVITRLKNTMYIRKKTIK